MSNRGTRLRELRQLHGMTQADFANTLGVTQSLLSAAERGLRPADSLTTKAAWIFRTGDRFFEEMPTDYGVGSLNYRTSKIPAKVQEAANRTFGELERAARQKLYGAPAIDVTAHGLGDRIEPLPVEQIEQIAMATRGHLQIGPTGPLPNVTRALEFAGIPVVELLNPFVDLTRIEGVSSPEIRSGRGVVAVTGNEAGDRVRFTRAHELGHLVLHTEERPSSERIREAEAHLFAGAFLMPAADAHTHITPSLTLEGYAQIKAKFAMSIAALVRRAKELRIIDEKRYRTLSIQISSRGWRKHEPVMVPVEQVKLLTELSVPALRSRIPANRVTGQAATVDAPGKSAREVVDLFGSLHSS